jgi:hypothetical protein
MIHKLLILSFLLLSFVASADTIKVSGSDVSYKLRDANHNRAFNKLSIEIEVSLVGGRLPNKAELKSVSDAVLKKQPKEKMTWVEFYLPKMKSGHGAYATNHTAPNPEGVNIMEFMLLNTPYKSLVK